MADKKYGSFFMGTMIKLSLFLVLCAAADHFSGRIVPKPFDKLVPALAAVFITWFFLTVIEKRSRSFFASGYLLQNVIIGGLWGLGAAVAGPLIDLAFKVRRFNLFPDIDLNGIMLDSVATGLFFAIVIYGYFFHILLSDFGAIPAIAVSSLVYGLLSAFEVMAGYMAYDVLMPAMAYYAILGVAAGMLEIAVGDMRSAAAFLFIYQLMSRICSAFTSGGRSFETDMAAPIMAVLCAAAMYFDMRKEKKEKERSFNIK